ncbi:hypothetical protein Mal15_38200 [Stieleria maiorica]|uniref:Uncharacterized protein n=1 Tax=Stieleria maiorica TaxID=2795974 RepID=A0A5B9MJD4_9BACT|nr:hypothetical protein [Stieleria maiorica]QEF99754.1 hypothetical protein Mal15_38200 [Stieleria maiorica]
MEIQREIINIIAGDWDVIWRCNALDEIYTSKAMFCAAVREYEVYRDTGGHITERIYQGDAVIPIDPNDCSIGSLVDNPEFIGFVPAGTDPHDPKFALDVPSIARDAS